MSAQFGRWNFDGKPNAPSYINGVKALLSPYGQDGNWHHRGTGIDLLWFSFETVEQRPKPQPIELASGEVLMWDGRLDNGPELAEQIAAPWKAEFCDIDIVSMAWLRWREECLGRFIGDWALTIWNPRDAYVLLAADFLATRHLFYAIQDNCVQWSTVPEPLVTLARQSFSLDEEYLAGWLGSFPAPHLTPYREIHRVPPASVVAIRPGKLTKRQYWDFQSRNRIVYARDRDYEERFLDLFRQSIRRRLRSTSPILAELSGGMDSSSIVCVADELTSASGGAPIDTVSFYDDREPHWNERPWFEKVEAQRRRSGLHIDLTLAHPDSNTESDLYFRFRPGAEASGMNPVVEYMMRKRHRVLLSGIGGDEFLGGVPTPLPELENLLARGRFFALMQKLVAWSLAQRRPWIHLLRDTAMGFLPTSTFTTLRKSRAPSWLLRDFQKRQWRALEGYPKRWRLFGPLPSFQENVDALDTIRRQLSCTELNSVYAFERRYPVLDRNLLEYLFAIPREQLVRPGQRRSLMRRALKDIVPAEILGRKRKAFVTAAPIRIAEEHYEQFSLAGCEIFGEAAEIIHSSRFLDALNDARQGKQVPPTPLMRTVAMERWLRSIDAVGSLRGQRVSFLPQAIRGMDLSSEALAQSGRAL
jgi:asparagine synthase (glutamine-hydrolysing)